MNVQELEHSWQEGTILSNRNPEQTIILITHGEKLALEADRIIALEDGRIIVMKDGGKAYVERLFIRIYKK